MRRIVIIVTCLLVCAVFMAGEPHQESEANHELDAKTPQSHH
ncbi:hypothetical protein [Pseudoalteromonas pernae]